MRPGGAAARASAAAADDSVTPQLKSTARTVSVVAPLKSPRSGTLSVLGPQLDSTPIASPADRASTEDARTKEAPGRIACVCAIRVVTMRRALEGCAASSLPQGSSILMTRTASAGQANSCALAAA